MADPPPPPPAPPTADSAAWSRRTLLLILLVTVARLVYLRWFCPYTLVEDEAHYWEWSRRLGWSYYSKGPGIALAIRAATSLLGTSEFSVRVPAVVAGAVAAWAIGRLSVEVSGSSRVGFFACAALFLSPIMQMIGIFSTIDGPYAACWAAAAMYAWRALSRADRSAWPLAGLAFAVGFLFKYTILLLLPGLLVFAMINRRRVRLAPGWPVWCGLGLLVACTGLAPVVIWNAQRGWPTVRHLLGHLGVAGGDMPVGVAGQFEGRVGWTRHLHEPLEFIATQFGMVGPLLIIALIAAAWVIRRRPPAWATADRDGGRLFLLCCAAPVLLFYVGVSFITEAEGNWALGAYVTLLPLAGWAVADALTEYARRIRAWLATPPGPDGRRTKEGIIRRKPELPTQMLWHLAVTYGLMAGVVMLRLDWVAAGAQRVGLSPGGIGRFLGADEMASHVAELASDLGSQTGKEPFVVARHYGRASTLAFYLRNTPLRVYCASSRMEGRKTQYDYWPDTDLDDPALKGRPAVLAGDGEVLWRGAFAQVQPVGRLRGDRKKGRPAFLGFDYRGFGSAADAANP